MNVSFSLITQASILKRFPVPFANSIFYSHLTHHKKILYSLLQKLDHLTCCRPTKCLIMRPLYKPIYIPVDSHNIIGIY